MPHRPLVRVVVLLIASVLPAAAGTGQPSDGAGRYALSPVEGGVLRLDKETGAMALCGRKGDEWSCDPVTDKAAALDARAKALESENARLKEQIKSLEAAAQHGSGATAPEAGPPAGSAPLPSEEEVDKAFDYVERMFKKLKERIQKFDAPEKGPANPPEPPADGKQL